MNKLRPSSASRWISCPGSVALEKGTANTSSEAATEGTASHTLAWLGLHSKLPVKNFKTVNVEGNDFTLDADQHRYVQEYVDFIYDHSGTRYFEQSVSVPIHDDVVLQGTLDACVVSDVDEGLIHIIDLKYGKYRVKAEFNPQLMIYALGMMYKLHPGGDWDHRRIEMTIYQPRVSGTSSSHTITGTQLRSWEQEVLKPAIEQITQGLKVYNPTRDNCKFCRGRPKCPAYSTQITEAVGFEAKPIDDLSNAEMVQIMKLKGDIEAYLKGIQKKLLTQLEGQATIPGVRIKYVNKNRAWRDEDEVVKVFGRRAKVTSVLSPKQLEDKLKGADPKVIESLLEDTGTRATLDWSDPERATATDFD